MRGVRIGVDESYVFDDVEVLTVKSVQDAIATFARLGATIVDVTVPSSTDVLDDMATLGQDPGALHSLLRFTAPFDASGSPTITLPSGFTAKGTPIALQLVAPHMSEEMLVRAGRAYQGESTWHRMHPAV